MLQTYSTSVRCLRRQAVSGAFGRASTLAEVFRRCPFVQADPIQAPARAQDLILRQRVRGYRAGDLDRAYRRLGLEEAYLHAYGFATVELAGLLHPRHDPLDPGLRDGPSGLASEVLAFVRNRPETHPGDLEDAFGRETATNSWGGTSKATTRALEALLHHGHIRVVGRERGIRLFGAAPAPAQDRDPAERLLRLAMVIVDLLAPVPARTLSAIVSGFARSIFGPSGGADAKAAVTRASGLAALEADGVRYVVRAGSAPPGAQAGRRVRFLAPFDPLVWDRTRFGHLWGWPYRFEAYVPPDRRKLGYYAMPLMWGEDVIGWVNCARIGGVLDVRPGYVSGRKRGTGYVRAFDEEVARLERFLGIAAA